MRAPHQKEIAAFAKAAALSRLHSEFPYADTSKFVAEAYIDEKKQATGDVLFKLPSGVTRSVFNSNPKYWGSEMKKALGIKGKVFESGFPPQLMPSVSPAKEVPCVHFSEKLASVVDFFNVKIDIFVTPNEKFEAKFREIFKDLLITHRTGKEAKAWMGAPDMKYWSQQLCFALWCATEGCGVSDELFLGASDDLPVQVRSFFRFHVYFTVRRILYQMGGIQRISALPGDPPLNKMNNPYDKASYRRLCAEFGIDPNTDFSYLYGPNGGYGNVYVWISYQGVSKTKYKYPGGGFLFSDEGGAGNKGNLIQFIETDEAAPVNWFVPKSSEGLTQAGLSRINQSI